MSTDFYVAAAQVIPVLLLTLTLGGPEFLIGEFGNAPTLFGKTVSRRVRLWIVGTFLILMGLGEIAALASLDAQQDSAFSKACVYAGLCAGISGLATVIGQRLVAASRNWTL